MEGKILKMSVEDRMEYIKKILSPENKDLYDMAVDQNFYDIIKSAKLDLTPKQKKYYNDLSDKYCRNGKCINPEKYVCCLSCNKKKPCTVVDDECLYFFCDYVLEKLSKEQREEMDLEALYQYNKKWEEALNNLIEVGFIEVSAEGYIEVKGEEEKR